MGAKVKQHTTHDPLGPEKYNCTMMKYILQPPHQHLTPAVVSKGYKVPIPFASSSLMRSSPSLLHKSPGYVA